MAAGGCPSVGGRVALYHHQPRHWPANVAARGPGAVRVKRLFSQSHSHSHSHSHRHRHSHRQSHSQSHSQSQSHRQSHSLRILYQLIPRLAFPFFCRRCGYLHYSRDVLKCDRWDWRSNATTRCRTIRSQSNNTFHVRAPIDAHLRLFQPYGFIRRWFSETEKDAFLLGGYYQWY